MDFQRCAFNWPILRKLSTEFSLRVKTFLVFGMGDDVLIQTNDEDITYGFGGNRFGLLGLGHSNAVMEQPEEIVQLTGKGVIDIRNGINHVLALTRNGELMAWGGNKVGQLGDGTTEDSALPKLIEHTERFAMVRCGSFHNVALTRNGRVYCWGSNEAGQCGQGNMERQLRPALVESLMDLVAVAIDCGSHVLALTD